MDNKTLLKMIFDGDESLLLKESQNKIEEAGEATRTANLQRAQAAKAKRAASSLQAQNATQDKTVQSQPTQTVTIPSNIITIEGITFESDDFKIKDGDENFYLPLESGIQQNGAKEASENFEKAKSAIEGFIRSLTAAQDGPFDYSTGRPLVSKNFFSGSFFMYKGINGTADFNYYATVYAGNKSQGQTNSKFSEYLTLIDQEKSSRSLGYTKNVATYGTKDEVKTISFSGEYLTAKDSIGNVHYFLPLKDLYITDLAYLPRVRQKLVNYIFSVPDYYDAWFKHIKESSGEEKPEENKQQQSRGLTTFTKDDLQQLQNELSDAFKFFTNKDSSLYKALDINSDNYQLTLYTGNYVIAESQIQNYKRLKEAGNNDKTQAQIDQERKDKRAQYDANKWKDIQASRKGYFNEPSVMELQINVNLKSLTDKDKQGLIGKGVDKAKEVGTSVKSGVTQAVKDAKDTFDQISKGISNMKKKNESISNIDLLYSIFSDNPLSILEEKESKNVDLIQEKEDGTVLEKPSSETTEPDVKFEGGLTVDKLKEIRTSLVNYLNQNANKITVNVDGKKIATEVIYDEGKDENVQVKNANQGFFSIIITKGKSAQTTGSKIGNAVKGAINTLAGVQPVSTGSW